MFESSGYLRGLSKDIKLTSEELKWEKFKSFSNRLRHKSKDMKSRSKAKVSGGKKTLKKTEKEVPRTLETNKSSKESSKDHSLSSKKQNSKKDSKEKELRRRRSHHRQKESSKKRRHRSNEDPPEKMIQFSSPVKDDDTAKLAKQARRQRLEKLRAIRQEREREERLKTEQLTAASRLLRSSDNSNNSDVVGSTSTSTSNQRQLNRDDFEEVDRQNGSSKITKSSYAWEGETPISKTRRKRDFPALGAVDVNLFLAHFAKVPANTAILPYGELSFLMSPYTVKTQKGKSKPAQRWTYPSDPDQVKAIRDLVQAKSHVLIPITFVSMYKKSLVNHSNHVSILHADIERGLLKYFDSNYTIATEKVDVEFKRLARLRQVIHRVLRLYEIKPKIRPSFKIEIVYATYGSRPGLTNNCTVFLFCLLDQLWEGKETVFPKFSASRVKCGEVMKALEIGTPNFLEGEAELKEWELQPWGAGRRH